LGSIGEKPGSTPILNHAAIAGIDFTLSSLVAITAVPQLLYLETIAAKWLFLKKKPPRTTFARA
jgi:hypothetical protein